MDNYLRDIENKIKQYFIILRKVESLKKELNTAMRNYENLNKIRKDFELTGRGTENIKNKISESENEILSIQEYILEAFVGYKILESAINNLNNEDMQLMQLRYVENLNYERIAQNLYTSKSTIFRKSRKIIMKIAENLN